MEEQEFENAIAMLLNDMQGDVGDAHEIFLRLKQTLDGMRAIGMPIPDDLAAMERDMAAEFEDEAKG